MYVDVLPSSDVKSQSIWPPHTVGMFEIGFLRGLVIWSFQIDDVGACNNISVTTDGWMEGTASFRLASCSLFMSGLRVLGQAETLDIRVEDSSLTGKIVRKNKAVDKGISYILFDQVWLSPLIGGYWYYARYIQDQSGLINSHRQ